MGFLAVGRRITVPINHEPRNPTSFEEISTCEPGLKGVPELSVLGFGLLVSLDLGFRGILCFSWLGF